MPLPTSSELNEKVLTLVFTHDFVKNAYRLEIADVPQILARLQRIISKGAEAEGILVAFQPPR